MSFRIYAAGTGGAPLWVEEWDAANSVRITDGLFNVMLGSLQPIPQAIITGNNTLWLGIAVGTDSEMTPRVQLASVPWAMQALTVPDGAIGSSKLANGAVYASKLSLDTDSVCLGSDIGFSLPGGWTRVAIPGMSVPLSMSRPAKVLVMASGIYNFTGGNHVGTSIFVNGNALFSTLTSVPNTGWQPFSSVRTISLPAGNHTLDLRSYAQNSGQVTYGGADSTTCLQYIVYSE